MSWLEIPAAIDGGALIEMISNSAADTVIEEEPEVLFILALIMLVPSEKDVSSPVLEIFA